MMAAPRAALSCQSVPQRAVAFGLSELDSEFGNVAFELDGKPHEGNFVWGWPGGPDPWNCRDGRRLCLSPRRPKFFLKYTGRGCRSILMTPTCFPSNENAS